MRMCEGSLDNHQAYTVQRSHNHIGRCNGISSIWIHVNTHIKMPVAGFDHLHHYQPHMSSIIVHIRCMVLNSIHFQCFFSLISFTEYKKLQTICALWASNDYWHYICMFSIIILDLLVAVFVVVILFLFI